MNIVDLAYEIHQSNVDAGWWTDLTTGKQILRERNRPEMLMLSLSEIGEAADGFDERMDDKLRHFPMFQVELADFSIRQYDLLGAEMMLHPGLFIPNETTLYSLEWLEEASPRVGLCIQLLKSTSKAMEAYRKGRTGEYISHLYANIKYVQIFCALYGIPLEDIVAQKRAFNKNRADHSLEARAKSDGKKF